ncbi:MAG: hypothetical protein MUC53_00250 [Candidatus Contendobacter sp.]|jgi:hypothetical protein|nr:hypothetical protein [Candidatus Contendobacter sp.]
MKAFIPCVAGQNPFAECLVEARGNLIRFAGHATMEFAPADALRLAELLQQWAAPLTRPDAADALPPLAQEVINRFQSMFPDDSDWTKQASIEYLVDSARDLFMILALAVETLRQEQLRLTSDGR